MVMCVMRILQVLYAMPFVFGMLYEAFSIEPLWYDAATKLPRSYLLSSTGNFSTLFKNKLCGLANLCMLFLLLNVPYPKFSQCIIFIIFCLKRTGKVILAVIPLFIQESI
jgi:hypothetical protein